MKNKRKKNHVVVHSYDDNNDVNRTNDITILQCNNNDGEYEYAKTYDNNVEVFCNDRMLNIIFTHNNSRVRIVCNVTLSRNIHQSFYDEIKRIKK